MSNHKSSVTDGFDKFLFIVIFLAGAAFIAYFKTKTEDVLLTIFIPVGLMFVYLFLTIYKKEYKLNLDKIADNSYYLGFLYTLTSLSTALYNFSDTDNLSQNVISNFGIALSTTIVGVALRVTVQQFRVDPVEYEENARLSLSDAANNFRAVMSRTISDMESFQMQSRDVMENNYKDMHKIFYDGLAESIETHQSHISSILDTVSKSTKENIKNSEDTNELTRRLVDSIKDTINKIDSIVINDDILAEKITPVSDKLNDIYKNMDTMSKAGNESASNFVKSVTQIGDAVSGVKIKIDDAVHSLENAKSISERVSSIEPEIETLVKSLKAIINQNKKIWEESRTYADNNSSILTKYQENYSRNIDKLSHTNDQLNDVLTKTLKASEQYSKTLVSLSNNIVKELQ